MTRKYQNIAQEVCKNAVIFARVSSEKQEKGVSIDAQLSTIYSYCNSKNLSIIKEFIITESSTKGDRKQYQEMLKFVQSLNHKVAIVVNCVDRLQRSYKDTPVLDDLRKEGRIEVHFLKENLILSKDSRGMDILFWNMCVLMANSYILSLSDNVKRSMEFNWSQGKWQSLAPIGYLNVKDENGKAQIIIDKERSPIIKRLFEEYATGLHSSYSLLHFANTLGLTSKEKNHHKNSVDYKKKAPIKAVTISAILKNPFYYGMMNVKGNLMPHIHGQIIDKALFDKVQKILEERSVTRKHASLTQRKTHSSFAFRGLISCGKCGKMISGDSKVKNGKMLYTYARCYHHCGQHPVNENVLLQQLEEEIFSKLSIPISKRITLKKSIIKKLDLLISQTKESNNYISQQLNDMSAKEDKLLNLLMTEKINEAIYDKKIAELIREKNVLQNKLKKQTIISDDLKNTINKVIDIIGNLSNFIKNATPKQKQELFNLLITNCVLNGKSLSYNIKSPFNKLMVCSDPKKWKDIIINNLQEFADIQYSINHLYE